jgi:hypothetical protein
MRTIDVTPTWEAILPAMLAVIADPDIYPGTKRLVEEEFLRMARLADLYKESVLIDTLDPA